MSNPISLKIEKIEIKDREYIRNVNKVIDSVAEKAAGMVLADTKRLVPVDTGTLRREIVIEKGKFASGDYHIRAQGPGNYSRYYASFVEMGTSDTPQQAYLRPALKKNRSKIKRMAQAALD